MRDCTSGILWHALKNIYPGGPQLIAKAKEIAVPVGKADFQGTSGWLSKWKKQYNVKRVTICGESGDVCGDTVTSWKERLPEILRGYDKRVVFNLDETGCFWRALPDHGFGQKDLFCYSLTTQAATHLINYKRSFPILKLSFCQPIPPLYYNR